MPSVSFLQKTLDELAAQEIISGAVLRNLSSQKLAPNETMYDFFKRFNVVVNIEEITRAIAKASVLPYFNLIGIDIPKKVLSIIPQEVAKNYAAICFKHEDNKIFVGFVNPQNLKALDAIDFLSKEHEYGVERYVISKDSFNNSFKQYRALASEVEKELESAKEQLGVKDKDEAAALLAEDKAPEGSILKRAPVSKIVSVIIRHAVEGKASDVHIEPMPHETRVRYRIDGVLFTSILLPNYVHSALVARIKVLAKLKIDETRVPQDGRMRMVFEGQEVDFRVSTLPLVDEEKVVMRILRVTNKAPTLEELGFLPRDNNLIMDIVNNPTGGMLIISGPTGSGKSTTLFSLLTDLNKEGVNIVTLEDPVEYFVKGVNQAQIRPEVGLTFATGLRSFLRQDPDIIMVGEVRDEETGELAIHAGLTGHFVLTTLHTNDAIGAVPRLIDMGIEPFFVSSTLRLVLAQRLARKICEDCKAKTTVPKKIEEEFIRDFKEIDHEGLKQNKVAFKEPFTFYRGKGCSKCGGSGYKGRLALTEVIQLSSTLKEIIVNGNNNNEVLKELKNQHFISMRQDGLIKVTLGSTTIEEVMRVTTDTEQEEEVRAEDLIHA